MFLLCMCEPGTPVNRIPIMAKQVLDLYMLYKLVTEKGGLVEVINKKLWREITKGLNLPTSITSAAFTLRTQSVHVSVSSHSYPPVLLCLAYLDSPFQWWQTQLCQLFFMTKQCLNCHSFNPLIPALFGASQRWRWQRSNVNSRFVFQINSCVLK